MSTPTHITMFDGKRRGPLVDYFRPYPDQIRTSLNTLDGASGWAYSLWRVPKGKDINDAPYSETFLQAAGSAEGMTIEMRTVETDGTPHHFVVGKPCTDPSAPLTRIISWADGAHSTAVREGEVFTADEAAEIFYAYFLTDAVPISCTLREMAA